MREDAFRKYASSSSRAIYVCLYQAMKTWAKPDFLPGFNEGYLSFLPIQGNGNACLKSSVVLSGSYERAFNPDNASNTVQTIISTEPIRLTALALGWIWMTLGDPGFHNPGENRITIKGTEVQGVTVKSCMIAVFGGIAARQAYLKTPDRQADNDSEPLFNGGETYAF